jgi:hypothetical protein
MYSKSAFTNSNLIGKKKKKICVQACDGPPETVIILRFRGQISFSIVQKYIFLTSIKEPVGSYSPSAPLSLSLSYSNIPLDFRQFMGQCHGR